MNRRRKPAALLIDLDGVLRLFDPGWNSDVESRHALAPGALYAAAFAPHRLLPAVTGRITHAEWMADIARAIGSPAATEEWETYRGDIDTEVLTVVTDLRAGGVPVGLATNATDRLDADLAGFGLIDTFDVVVNASVIGAAKPHPDFYRTACELLDVPAHDCLFVDDSPRFVAGARAAGLLAYRYTGHAGLPYLRRAFAP